MRAMCVRLICSENETSTREEWRNYREICDSSDETKHWDGGRVAFYL